jgi:arsenate reductase-like glutaredoxin family protein
VNIQIFGTRKNQDTRKAERFFKERGIRYQFVDMKEKGLSRGEFESVKKAVGGLDNMIDQGCKDKDLLALITWIAEEDRAQKVLENQSVLKLPIVRNGRQATIGCQPEIWKTWS